MTLIGNDALYSLQLLDGSNLLNLQALPDDLKTKLSIDDDLVSSPKEALSRASADRRMKYLGRYCNYWLQFDMFAL